MNNKVKLTVTIDKPVMDSLDTMCDALQMNKSALVNMLLANVFNVAENIISDVDNLQMSKGK